MLRFLAKPLSLVAALTVTAGGPVLANQPMWVVEDDDSTVYMVGTVHMLRADIDWRTEAFEAAFAASDDVWLEIAGISNPPANLMALIIQYGISPDIKLTARLTPKEVAQLEAVLEPLGVPIASLDDLEPWFAYLQLAGLILARAGFDPMAGIDMMIEQEAELAGKPVRGFETFESQFQDFASISTESQLGMLLMTIAEFDVAMEDFLAQMDSWFTGDLEPIEEMIQHIREQVPEFHEVLFVQRNHGFVDGIEEILAGEGVSLVAVGLAHFAGPGSIPEILEQRGYSVIRK